MFTSIFRTCFSFGAQTTFEKARLKATYAGDTQEPTEEDIKVILNTLGGNDLETKPQVAYHTIVSKLETSDSKDKWNYLMKNLVILDRCVESRFYLNDIRDLNLPSVSQFTINNPKLKYLQFDTLVREYFQLIKEKCVLYQQQNSSFNVERKQKKKYFENLELHMIFQEIRTSQKMHDRSFQVTDLSTKAHSEHQIINYVFIYILALIFNLYSTQYSAIFVLIERMQKMGLEQCLQFEKLYNKFLQLSQKTAYFVKQHKDIPGFGEIKQDQFYSTDQRITNCIKEYQDILRKNRGSSQKLYKEFAVVNLDKETFNTDIEIIVKHSQSNILNNNDLALNIQKSQQFYQIDEKSAHKEQDSSLNNTSSQHKFEQQLQQDQQQQQSNSEDFSSKNINLQNKNKSNEITDFQYHEEMVARKVKSITFQGLKKSEESNGQSYAYSEENGTEINYEQFQLGYSLYIKQNSQYGEKKISRLDFERTNLEKNFKDAENQDFNFSFFSQYQEVFSTEQIAQRPVIRKSGVINQAHKQQQQLTFELIDENPFYVNIDPEDEQEECERDQFIQSQLIKQEQLKIKIDWEKLNKFEENIFDNYISNYSTDDAEVQQIKESQENTINQSNNIVKLIENTHNFEARSTPDGNEPEQQIEQEQEKIGSQQSQQQQQQNPSKNKNKKKKGRKQ